MATMCLPCSKQRVITCKTCGITGHNSRTCGKSPSASPAEKRAAESLAKLLGPKPRVITCKTCGVAGHNSKTCGKQVKPEPVKQVSLQGVTMFKEPKGYYTAYRSPEVKPVSLLGVSMFTEPKGYSSVNAKRMAHEGKRKITCQKCGCEGHNARTCFMSPPTSNGVAVVASTPKRTAATKRIEDRIVEDFNPTDGDMKNFLLEQCKIWGIETQ